jgi:hypothetical protein
MLGSEHPKPYRSQLWKYVDEIRQLRRRRWTWREITEHLRREHGVHVTLWTVQKFARRVANGKRQPLWFGTSAESATQETDVPEKTPTGAPIKAKRGFPGYDPAKGLNYQPKD